MSFFPAARSAMLAGRTVYRAELLFLDFVGAPSRYWMGAGPLATADGNTWAGLDGVGKIDGLQYALGTVAPKVTLSISGLDATIQGLAQSQSTTVKNRGAKIYWQFFDASWNLLDTPYALWSGLIDTMAYRMTDGDKGKIYQVSVAVEGVWTGRNRPSAGCYDPQDQAARGYPGDTGLDQIPALMGQTIVWKPT